MKAPLGKFAIAGLISFALSLPLYTFSQDDNSPAPAQDDQQYTPPDTPPGQDDQQLDQQEAPPSSQPISTQEFYTDLNPYGQWVNYGNYGYVWIPSAGPNFAPYSTAGHWVYTDYGWTWVSDYPWGWAVFHYGRWAYDDAYGWFWIPGVEWGPAWVAWRHCDGYYGWAPLYPGIDISASFDWWGRIPTNYWCFVNERYIGDRYVWRHYEPRGNNVVFIRNSTIIRNTYYDRGRGVTYAAGPQREEVERTLHTTIRPVPVRESGRPEQRYDQAHLHLYRPNVSNPANTHPTPSRPVDIRQVPQRNAPNNSDLHQNVQRQAPSGHQQIQRPQAQPRSAPARGGGGGRRH